MKSLISKILMLITLGVTILSFSAKPGGEGFEISLNNKVVIQRYGSDMNRINRLPVKQSNPGDQITVKYYHCGRVGKGRIITIISGNNKVLKVFRFADVSIPVAPMLLPVKDILKLKRTSAEVKLYYSSSELPKGRLLVSLLLGPITSPQP